MSIEANLAAVLAEHLSPDRDSSPAQHAAYGAALDAGGDFTTARQAASRVYAQEVAAMLAPLVREAQRAAFEVGVTRGIAYQAGNNDALANPYRIEKEA